MLMGSEKEKKLKRWKGWFEKKDREQIDQAEWRDGEPLVNSFILDIHIPIIVYFLLHT